MSGPRAVGTHLPYAEVPAPLRAWVDDTLGSPVVRTAEQTGGMSPGCATRLVCADGTRAFVKAVGADLNPDSPTLHRREVVALGLLGSHPLWADLLASYDDGSWVALLLEDVEGHHPDLTDDTTMARLLEATDELVRVMHERVPQPPRPPEADGNPLYRPGLTDLGAVFRGWSAGLDHAGEVPGDLMPRWVVERADDLRAGLDDLARVGTEHLVHYDIRNDNLLVRPDGSLVFLDWGGCGIGPDWLDPMLARLERVHLPWFDDSLETSPALARAGDDLVTAALLGLGAFLAYRAHTAVDVNLPTLAAFRRRESARFLGAAARRLGIPPD
ncbi:phosphotransferase [Nocardioides rubriscoriae]|uniref:phosphotransferase n=1 Tax=Nocardioides rubriscoriae TaxID=642762 RepID=UPI0011DF19CC|nr:phosphotransferase [Nocardioides rubriscoriae]